MTTLFTPAHTKIPKTKFQRAHKALAPYRDFLKLVLQERTYASPESFLRLPFDKRNLKQILKLHNDLPKNIGLVVVIGIGGSNLGTVAVCEALGKERRGKQGGERKLLTLDTVDGENLYHALDKIKKTTAGGRHVVINVISKSGTTTETIANFEALFGKLKTQKTETAKHIHWVVTSDNNSPLHQLAQDLTFPFLEIPKKVEGRFSVFSPVGLFPLLLLGVDIETLLEGARDTSKHCLTKDPKNPAPSSAATVAYYRSKGFGIWVHFLFDAHLESLGHWTRQLIAESLGKERDLEGKTVRAGILPQVAIGSTDLHSLLQLYIAGPKNIFTTFIRVANPPFNITIPPSTFPPALLPSLRKKSFNTIMDAIYRGVTQTYREQKLPSNELVLTNRDEYALGAYLQFKMIETIFLAKLWNINPFGQSNVERYKKITRKILSLKP